MSTLPQAAAMMTPELAAEQLPTRMGIELVEVSRERVVGTMPVTGNRQPFGLLHGGASGVLVETLGSVAAAQHTMPERFPVGLELSCTHHASATEGVVTGIATPVHVGRSTSTFEVVITDERGRRTCTGKLTCMHLDRKPGPAAS
ncbi:PaaI family thioesterase [Pseudonocardia spinosispora]|uniref:PaaI family thioesterase n=1 Tax=Pseudonocardia spinosispora TaxID=103441 RepID=UPI000415DFF2|nr:hotdog fold thioesterase [Pseudonocardia spinosispora]